MRAVVLTEHGGPEVLRISDIPVPQPDAEEVLVAVRATALNRADLLQRMGMYPNPSPAELHVPLAMDWGTSPFHRQRNMKFLVLNFQA